MLAAHSAPLAPPPLRRAPPRRAPLRRAAAAPRAAAATEAAAAAAYAGPPASFDHRAATAAAGAALAAAHPSLAPLIAEGLLLSLPRPAGYVERRSDGYEAPRHVWLLGTAHLSRRSAADVAAAVAALRPDAVVVELCRSRAGVMYDTVGAPDADALAMGGESFGGALSRSLRLGGGGALLLRAALSAAARRAAGAAGAGAGAAPGAPALGAEFAAARAAAEACGATLVLGDRPVEITLRRALAAASGAERARALRLLAPLLLPRAPGAPPPQELAALTPAALDALLPDADAVSALFARFAADFPSLAAPLVHERDAYLAWSLCRSKAVCGAAGVLGVVGAGHLRGVAWALQHEGGAPLRFDALVGRDADRAAAAAQPPLWRRWATDALLWGGAAAAWTALAPHDRAG
jgi:pheromone shutdown protein TraB